MTNNGLRTRLMAGACGVLALGVAGEGATRLAERAAVRTALVRVPGLSVGAVETPFGGRIVVRRASLVRSGVRITADRLALPARDGAFGLVASAIAGPATTTADNIRIDDGNGGAVTIPHVELHGGSIADALAALNAGDHGADLAGALAKLSFDSLAVPEVSETNAGLAGDAGPRATLRNLLVSGMGNGRIAALSADGITTFGPQPHGQSRPEVEVGRIEAQDIDLALVASMTKRAPSEAPKTVRPLVGSIKVADMVVTQDSGEVFKVTGFEVGGVGARPLSFTPKRFSELAGMESGHRSAAERAELADDMQDAASAGTIDRLALRGISFKGVPPDSVEFGLDEVGLSGFTGLKLGEMFARGFHLASPDVDMRLGSYALRGLDESGLLDALGRYRRTGNAGESMVAARGSSRFGEASLHDLAISAVAKDMSGNANGGSRTNVSIPLVELKGGSLGTASQSSGRVQAIFDIVSPAPGSALEQGKANGFDHFDITWDYASSWDATTRILDLGHVTVAAKDLASLTLAASVSGLSQDVLSGDQAAVASAVKDMRLQSLSLTLVNAGLFEKGWPVVAKGADMSVPDLKVQAKQQVEAVLSQSLGEGPVVHQITAAVEAFIDQPKTLSIVAKAPGGLALDTITNAKTPEDLLKRLDVKATANP